MAGRRILFLGTSGSGKTTCAKATAARLGVPHIELDSIRHQADWVEMPDDQFHEAVARRADEDSWVMDGNYSVVRELTASRATIIAWLDLPRWQVMAQVTRRSIIRAATGRELWNGNRERWSFFLRRDHPVRWAWDTYDKRKAQYAEAMTDKWVRLTSHADFRRWLDEVASSAG